MSASRKPIPTYRKHRRTGRAIITVRTTNGARRDILLPGPFKSAQSRQEYERILAHLRVHGGNLPDQKEAPSNLTVAELMVRFMEERVIPYYVDPDTKEPTSELPAFRAALTPLKRLYADLPANEFNPQHMRSVRDALIVGSWMTEAEKERWTKAGRKIGLTRTTVNKHIARIKMMFRWAAEMMIVPAAVFHTLATVAGLRRGRSAAREGVPVKPVAIGAVEATLPYLGPVVRDVVELLLMTGMRVGEATIMRAIDIDMTGPVWLFRPEAHKNAWRGHQRVVAIGPKAQEIVRRHLKPRMDAYLFSPREQRDVIFAAKRQARKTKVQPSQLCRKKAKPKKLPGEQFGKDAINHAIRAACQRAGIPRWHTHQLRHTAALEISRLHGLEAARAVLGHRTVQMSAHYSGLDQATAAEVMAKIG